MQKNRFLVNPLHTASPMSPAHSYTIVRPNHDGNDDDDDSDICPVCDGECTCRSTRLEPPSAPLPPPPAPTPGAPLSMAELSRRYAAAGASPGATSLSSPSSGLAYPPSSPTPNSTPTPAPSPPKPSLKIKLTVPPGMLAKRRLTNGAAAGSSSSSGLAHSIYMNGVETTSDYANAGYNSTSDSHLEEEQPLPLPPKPAPKKRGRPPKHLARQAAAPPHSSISPPYKPLNPKSAAPGKQHKRSSSTKVRQNLKARASLVKKAAKKRCAITSDEESSSDSTLSGHGDVDPYSRAPYIEDVMQNDLFPTFVSASSSSSVSSDNEDSSELSDFDSDGSLVKEEENFIIADVHEKARLKRELLGGDDPLLLQRKRSNRNSDWVVRPRKKSVGPSDAEMDVDSDATEDDDDDDDEDDEDAEEDDDETEEDTVMLPAPPPVSQEEEEEDADEHRRRYVGFATGWSEDEESGLDAELFFAHLLDSDDESNSESEAAGGLQPAFSLGEEGDQSDISCTSDCTEGSFSRRRAALESLPFEVTEGWDGQIVFTNGIHDHQGIIDIEFEADASRFVTSPSRSGDEDDPAAFPRRRRSTTLGGFGYGLGWGSDDDADSSSDVAMSEGGYLEEDGEGELGEGDTTDEELVGADDLPNERAMRLFSLPLSVSAINPLSTVSTPNVSPGRRRRADAASRERMIRRWGGEGVSASDILQGRVLFWDSDEMEYDGEDGDAPGGGEGKRVWGLGLGYGRGRGRGSESGSAGEGEGEGRKTPMGPRKGVFVHCAETRQAVIGDDKKGDEVPSPHPRFNRGRSRTGRFSSVEHLLRRHLLQSLNASSPSPLGSPSASSIITPGVGVGQGANSSLLPDDRSPLELLLSSAAAVAAASGSAPEDVVSAAVSVSESVGVGVGVGVGGMLGVQGGHGQGEAETIELGDVLEASFLDDPEPEPSCSAMKEGEGVQGPQNHEQSGPNGASHNGHNGTSTNNTTHSTAADEPGVKNLSRWDLISVGAFRQSREAGHLHHTPHSSADFGSAIKSSPLSAVLWQNASAATSTSSSSHSHSHSHGHGHTHGHSGPAVGTGGARQAPGAGLIKGKGSKLAKRRRIMMGGGGSAMSSPLILPVGSSSSPPHGSGASPSGSGSGSASTSLVPYKHHHHHHHQKNHDHSPNNNQNQNQNRKESRRERKLLKKRSSGGPVHAPHLAHAHHGHAFHTHHQHLPNAKSRSVSGAQRAVGWGVPPLNL